MQNTFAPTLPRYQTLILIGGGVCLLLGLSLTIAAYMLLPINPNGDELILMLTSWISYVFIFTMNLCLCVTFAAAIFAVIVYNYGKGLTINHTVLELTGGEKVQQLNAVTISPDVLIVSQTSTETKRDLLEKFNQAKANQVDGVWIVCIAYQDVTGLLITDTGESYAFDRNTPPFQADETENPIAAHDYKAETWAEYQAYLNEFCYHFTRWAPREKLIAPTGKSAEKKINVLWSLSVLFVLFAFPLSAQKSVRVMEYLGQTRYMSVKPTGQVKFVFEDATINRTANGTKTYAEILKAGTHFNDADNAGRLIAIQVVNAGQIKTVYPDKAETPQTSQTASASVTPQSALPAPGEMQLDDSLQTALMIEGLKQKFDLSAKKVWGQSLQWWDFGRYIFDHIFYVVLCLLGLARFVAKTASNETRISAWGTGIYGGYIHNVAAAATLITYLLMVLVALVLLLDIFIIGVTGNISAIFLLFFSWKFVGVCAWFGMLRLFERFTDYVVPNPKIINEAPPRMHAGPNQYKGLNQ
jgi:hypothetical protein